MLAIPSKNGHFILETDASNVGIGGELLQIQDGIERTISFASFTLGKAQRNYCTTKRELLAIIRFVDTYRHYLLGKKFTIRTDHHSLQWLMTFKNPEGIIARWIEELSKYHFDIVYKPGKEHIKADALSRCLQEPICASLPDLPCG